MEASEYIEQAEKKVWDIPGLSVSLPKREIQNIGVIGAGTMGGGIAMNFANAGMPVHIVETDQEKLDLGIKVIASNYNRSIKRGKLTEDEFKVRMSKITSSTSLTDLIGCDLIIEAVYEDIELKKQIFKELDKTAKSFAILATNTSALDINEIALQTLRPDDIIGLHFFSPANVMKLLEIVRAKFTSDVVVASCLELARRINKVPALVGVCPGFVGNRILFERQKQALNLIYQGVMPWEVDKALNEFGFKMGPFQMSDLAGLDIGWKKGAVTTNKIRDALCELDRRGQKTGAGYYDYDENRVPKISKITENIIKDITGHRDSIKKETNEIIELCIFPMINEALKILEEGMAQRPSDIDVVWLNGYGFPQNKGGLLFWADQIGPDKILSSLMNMKEKGYDIEISDLLRSICKNSKNILEFAEQQVTV